MQTYIGPIADAGNRLVALFRVVTNHGDVLMSIRQPEHGGEARAIVEVRRDAFFGLWRNGLAEEQRISTTRRSGVRQSKQTFETAEPYAWSETGGPLPVAEVVCQVRSFEKPHKVNQASFTRTTTLPYVSFVDGIDRALWLSSLGARSFPVECLVAQAPLLSRLAAAPRSHWMRVSELTAA